MQKLKQHDGIELHLYAKKQIKRNGFVWMVNKLLI